MLLSILLPHLEHDADVLRDLESLPAGEGEDFVVVQDAVKVLGPLWINVSVEDDPVPAGLLPALICQYLGRKKKFLSRGASLREQNPQKQNLRNYYTPIPETWTGGVMRKTSLQNPHPAGLVFKLAFLGLWCVGFFLL